MTAFNEVSFKDSASIDAFGRLRVSSPQGIFDNQFTYDLSPLIYEQVTSGSGASIAHDATNRNAVMTFASTPTGGSSFMQSYEPIRYQPGKSQMARLTFNFKEQVANALKFIGYSDGVNGIEFQNTGAANQIKLYSGTAVGDKTVLQSAWSLDRLNGANDATNPSGITLDIAKSNHFVIDMEALYVGRVRCGFDIGGVIVYVHEFLLANTEVNQYLQSANLPVRCGMTCTGTVSTTMIFHCSAVASEGGQKDINGYEFATEGSVTAASGARTHIMSIRPKTTFNSIENRIKMAFIELDFVVTGGKPILWELCVGQAISGTTTYADVNSTYSGMEVNTAGTISGSPEIVIDSGYVAATNQSKGTLNTTLTARYPITLDQAGNVRALGTLSVLVTGLGGSTACRLATKYLEVR